MTRQTLFMILGMLAFAAALGALALGSFPSEQAEYSTTQKAKQTN